MIAKSIKWLLLLIVLLTALTGLRISLFNSGYLPTFLLSWIDSISYGGNIFNQHLYLGEILFGLVILLSAFGAWQFLRMREVHVAGKKSWMLKKSIMFAIYTLLGSSILSGLLIYSGRIDDLLLYATVENVHTYSFYGLLGLGIGYLIVVYSFRKDTRVSQYEKAGSGWVTGLVFLVSIGISALAVYGVCKFLEKPATLVCKNINRGPIIDGRASGIEWVGADSLSVIVSNGDNFPDKMVEVKIKAFHNFRYIYFLFQWADPEPSHNHSLIKTENGWKELKSEYSPFGESVYFEDQLAILFHKDSLGCAASCHLGNSAKAGLHYTPGDTADLWYWKSTSTNSVWEADDGWWGQKINDTIGGRHFDNSPGGGYITNLNEEWDEPYFLPAYHAFDNWIWTGSDRYQPYRAGLDNYEIGQKVPGMLVSNRTGDRGDIYARGQWRNGVWTLEMSRLKNTGSTFDVKLREDAWFDLALFDNSEIKHAYHLKPIRLIIEK